MKRDKPWPRCEGPTWHGECGTTVERLADGSPGVWCQFHARKVAEAAEMVTLAKPGSRRKVAA